jgi:hypothetical protein
VERPGRLSAGLGALSGSLARQPSLASPHPAACSAPAPPTAPGSRPGRLVPPTGPAAPRPAPRRIGRAPVCGAQPPGPGGGPGPDEAPRGARGRTRRVQGVTNGVSACSPSPGAPLTPTHPNPAETPAGLQEPPVPFAHSSPKSATATQSPNTARNPSASQRVRPSRYGSTRWRRSPRTTGAERWSGTSPSRCHTP